MEYVVIHCISTSWKIKPLLFHFIQRASWIIIIVIHKTYIFFFFAFATKLHKTYQDVQLIMHQVQTRSWECISQTSEYHLLQMKSQTSLQQNYTSQKEKKKKKRKTNTKELGYTVYDSETIILVNIICVNFARCNTSRIIDIFSTLIKSTFSFCKNTPNECHQCE